MKYLYALSFVVLFSFNAFTSLAQAPANDECANAIMLVPNEGPWTVNNLNTVVNGPEPGCGGTGIKDIWFSFVYTGGNITIQTVLGTLNDTRMALYGSCGGSVILCNDDNGNYSSLLNFTCAQLTNGNTYYLQAGGFNALVGEFELNITSAAVNGCTNPIATNYDACATVDDGSCVINGLVANDECAGAFPITIGAPAIQTSNVDATSNGANPTCGNQGTNQMMDVWFSFVADGTELDINVPAGSLTDTRLAVYHGCGGQQVECDDDAGPGNAAFLHFGCGGLIEGDTYYLRVGGYGALTGTFSVSVVSTNNCNLGESCNIPYSAAVGNNTSPAPNNWFIFNPPSNGQWRITTCGLNTCDTKIWLYDYCQMANFDDTNEATFTYNDDFCGVQSEITPILSGSSTYYMRIGDTNSACADTPIEFLIEYMGPVVGCTDILACNFSPIAEIIGPCYYNGDPMCDDLGPDLEVLLAPMYNSLYSTTINGTDACLVNEGCLQGLGVREILRFTTHIKNIGNQDYFIGVPSANNDQFEWDQCHNHYHYEGYAEYLLYNSEGLPMPQIGFKNGFCVLDLECSGGGVAQYGCGNMGITAGCGDIYSSGLSCQWVDVTDVPGGDYTLVIRTNWDQSPDNAGHYELRYDNNWAQVCIHFDRDANGALINFTKSITSCPLIIDCLGQPFGDIFPDCAGNCPGVVVRGDVVNDNSLTEDDVHHYVLSTIDNSVDLSFCSDLNNDGLITVTDAVMLEACIHGQEELGVDPEDMTDCPYDDELVNIFMSSTVGISSVNTEDGYVDVYILNPDNEVKGIEFEVSGITIASVVALPSLDSWDIIMEYAVGGVHISAMGHEPTFMDKFSIPEPIFRIYVQEFTAADVCISSIIDVVNLDNHNTLSVIGDCQQVQLSFASFSASSNDVCQGESVMFTDTSLRDIISWSWTFEGGTPATSDEESPVVVYSAPGVYSVTLTLFDGIFTDTYMEENFITVVPSQIYYADSDGDGYGNSDVSISSCEAIAGYVTNSDDCDDTNASMYPGAPGTNMGVDNNCNTVIDPEEVAVCECDLNGDGFVDINDLLVLMSQFGCSNACTSDLSGDGIVGSSDVAIFMGCYMVNCP